MKMRALREFVSEAIGMTKKPMQAKTLKTSQRIVYDGKVRVVRVDMNEYLGRSFHPKKSDIGRYGAIVDIHAWYIAADGSQEDLNVLAPGGHTISGYRSTRTISVGDPIPDDVEVMYHVEINDDKGATTRELMDHEVEYVD